MLKSEGMNNTLTFENAKISGVVTTVGDLKVSYMKEAETLGLSDKEARRTAEMMGFDTRYIVSDATTTSDLCYESASNLIASMEIDVKTIDGLIFVSQTPDYQTPATATVLQDRLDMRIDTMCFDINLGCSGFVYGLSVAYSLIEAGMRRFLLCVGDTASKIVDPTDKSVAPIMGDAGSCILVEADRSPSVFQLYSDGSGKDALIMHGSGARDAYSRSDQKSHLKMNGADVFSFSIRRVPHMIKKVCSEAQVSLDELDFLLMHQPNMYMVDQITKRLEIDSRKVPSSTQCVFGNQNSASIPGTLNGIISNAVDGKKIKVCLAGFGVGLSWGAAVLTLDRIFCPEVTIWRKK